MKLKEIVTAPSGNTIILIRRRKRPWWVIPSYALITLVVAGAGWIIPALVLAGEVDLKKSSYICRFGKHDDRPWWYNATDHTCCDYDVRRMWYCVRAKNIGNPFISLVILNAFYGIASAFWAFKMTRISEALQWLFAFMLFSPTIGAIAAIRVGA